MTTATPNRTDLDHLNDLNLNYIRSVQESDVAWFDENLADDFMCTFSDGSLVDRAAFLDHTAHPAHFTDLAVHDVVTRLLDDFAIIHARTSFRGSDGTQGASRYTDIWARRDGKWKAISAQITRY